MYVSFLEIIYHLEEKVLKLFVDNSRLMCHEDCVLEVVMKDVLGEV